MMTKLVTRSHLVDHINYCPILYFNLTFILHHTLLPKFFFTLKKIYQENGVLGYYILQ